ncbi:unnamed protein product [Triticum turgidum subsp. durum]|uniref:Seipin n=1 Tax=Triticum turgidum subsp. durum TaxID=4567 RepID=A0A9R0WA44_TRITD|nr:unnamed protein product [Triticum turgidum subsp. durum]
MLTWSSYPMDPGPHHPSTYNHHHHYPFLPAAGPPTAGGDTLLFLLAIPAGWLVRLVAFLGERVISAVLTLVVLPGATLVGELRTVPAAAASLARRAAVGVLAAAFTFAALAVALVASLLLGFVLIRHWVEDPVTVRQPLYFDYTEPQPSAAVALVPPAGHSVRVSMSLLLPDSDHNRQIGVFQVQIRSPNFLEFNLTICNLLMSHLLKPHIQIKTEAITPSGSTVASATQPYMLRYKSAPVRLAQSALTIVPLALGMRSESQSATLKLLQYWEGHGRHKRTRLIRVSLQPRAMTVHLPQVYRAEITVQTALPWFKAVARSLKWTMCVWLSFWVYVILSLLAVRWVWPLAVSAWDSHRGLSDRQVNGKTIAANQGGGDIGQSSHEGSSRGGAVRWRDRRGRRKAQQTPHGGMVELKLDEGSSYSSAVAETDEVVDDES